MKIVWLCHFSNSEVQDLLPLWKRKNEFAPWIPNVLQAFEHRQDIELHVISPHEYLKRSINIKLRNINYSFIPVGIPFFHRHWPGIFRFDIFSRFRFFRKRALRVIRSINPDIINLIGAENAYYSSVIFDVKDEIPVIVGIQGFISQFKEIKKNRIDLKCRIEIEERILSEFKYFYGEQDSSTYINHYNPTHKFFRLYFPINEELAFSMQEHAVEYDCIYYGRLEVVKGVADFIKVIAELKHQRPNIRACIAGGGKREQFEELAKELNCLQNIDFKGFLKTQKELFGCVKASKVFLAPPYKERLSLTIREAMLLKVPIVAYATGGIPYVNEFDENILLVETGDYKLMADKTLYLLEHESERVNQAERAYNYAINEYSLDVNTERLIAAYREIVENKN